MMPMVLWLITSVARLGIFQPPIQNMLFENWAELRQYGINVVVCSENEAVLEAIKPYGLLGITLPPEEAAYYKTYFQKLKLFPSDMVGFFNGDNVFDGAGLASTIQVIRRDILARPSPPHVLLVGQRKNAANPDCIVEGGELKAGLAAAAKDGSARVAWIDSACGLSYFMPMAQDYFIMDRPWLDTLLPRMPLSRLGGVVFDNWLTEVRPAMLALTAQGAHARAQHRGGGWHADGAEPAPAARLRRHGVARVARVGAQPPDPRGVAARPVRLRPHNHLPLPDGDGGRRARRRCLRRAALAACAAQLQLGCCRQPAALPRSAQGLGGLGALGYVCRYYLDYFEFVIF
jgi:hypothetical protein